VLRSTRKLSTDARPMPSTALIEQKDTDAVVRGSNTLIEQETIRQARWASSGGGSLR
jgi:hypothetical protein